MDSVNSKDSIHRPTYIKYLKIFGLSFLAILGTALAILTILLLVAVGITLTSETPPTLSVDYSDVNYKIEANQLERFVDIMGKAIQFKSVSTAPHEYDKNELLKLQLHLRDSYPNVFDSDFINVEIINSYSILLTIQGSEKNLKPYMLTAHLDVVPVDSKEWTLDPFLGKVVADPVSGEQVIWGRGAIDCKAQVVGILSAMDVLIQSGWKPRRSFFVGFGHDEEVGGADGAAFIGQKLRERNVKLDFLLDEGLPITEGIVVGLDFPLAAIGVSEKGRMNVNISVEGLPGGHSSIPPHEQAIGILASALDKIYKNPLPSMLGQGLEKDMLEYMAPNANWPYNMLLGNLWLFKPAINFVMSKKRETNAMLRTTTAITIIRGGVKDNVVPTSAWALVNHRVHPGNSLQEVLEYDKAVVADDRVKVEMTDSAEPHPIAPYGPDSIPYSLIASAIKSVYTDAVPVPGLCVGNTDSRHYLNLTDARNYRFVPLLLNAVQLKSIHGSNENLSIKNLESSINFFINIIAGAEILVQ